MTLLKFRQDLWQQNTRVPGLLWHCFCDPVFSRFNEMPTCDKRTDRQADIWRDRHMTTANTVLAECKTNQVIPSQAGILSQHPTK